jgi:hypothetical protein
MTHFLRLVRAEWTKFRTVRGWVIATAAGALVIMVLGLAPGMQGSCGQHGPGSECVPHVGPDGEPIHGSFSFVHQELTGDGSLTVRVATLTGLLPTFDESHGSRAGLVPWAKAGLIIKDGTRQGSTYAAVMLTGSHGVRMQHDFTHDRAGTSASASAPRWLRLTRAGPAITGEESADGVTWTTVGTVHLPRLPSTLRAGLFVTSPGYVEHNTSMIGLASTASGTSQATATFDHLGRAGAWADRPWAIDVIGAPAEADTPDPRPTGSEPSRPESRGSGTGRAAGSERGGEPTAAGFTVTGSGDIAPVTSGPAGLGTTITQTLVGTFAGLIFIVVVAALFITVEYRRGLIRTTLSAGPRRGRTLAAKAVVLGAVTFLTGLVTAAAVVTFGQRVLRANGVYVLPASFVTELRLIVGTAALLAIAALLALGLGTLLRRSVTAVTTAVAVTVLPYLLAVTVLPAGAAQWLLRVTPAAAFALQQSTPAYHHVADVYTPAAGYFPLAPWAGFAVLCAWTAAVLGLAAYRLRRRDA